MCIIMLFTGILTAAIRLDRETVSKYHLTARAVDPGDKSCTMDIYITIRDVNDNAPVFEEMPKPVFVSEGAAVNTLVYRVSATDADLGKSLDKYVLHLDGYQTLFALSCSLKSLLCQSLIIVFQSFSKSRESKQRQFLSSLALFKKKILCTCIYILQYFLDPSSSDVFSQSMIRYVILANTHVCDYFGSYVEVSCIVTARHSV